MKSELEHERLMNRYHDEDVNTRWGNCRRSDTRFLQPASASVLVALLLSVSINFFMVSVEFMKASRLNRERTSFAHLNFDIETVYSYDSVYNSQNYTEADAAWDAISYNMGNIALDYTYAAEKGLPAGQQFPWDDTKGIYFMGAIHSLHCLKWMREATVELYATGSTTHHYPHLMHCFEVLLNDLKCYADDTPLATFRDHPGRPGVGQKRQCRDWDGLIAFAEEHYSCWRDIEPKNKELDPLLRYRFCPKDSPYNDWVNAVFGELEEETQL